MLGQRGWLLILIYIFIKNSSCVEPPDLNLLVKNERNYTEFLCIAEGNVVNSAVGWIYPIPETADKIPTIVTSYVPDEHNDFDCNFLKFDQCNSLWQMEHWQSPKIDLHKFIATLDPRWEDFETYLTSNSTKTFSTRIEIPLTFQLGISVKAERNAEIFVCEGWNPHNYPCYHVNIGTPDNKQIYLKKYKTVPVKSITNNDTKLLAKYKSTTEILSKDEWKTFVFSLYKNGTIQLLDKYKNELLLNCSDKKMLEPIYLLIRSQNEKALWKIHNNNFISTYKTGISSFGPPLNLYSSNLCISLYTSICKYCKITFFMIKDGKNVTLYEKDNYSKDENQWEQIRLTYSDIFSKIVKLYVKTSLTNSTVKYPFWAISDVRTCFKNEIRVSKLRMSINNEDRGLVSCQALNFPHWRPTQTILSSTFSPAINLPSITATSTVVKIILKGIPKSIHSSYFLVYYEGQDFCDNSSELLTGIDKRSKSRGYVIGRTSDIVIKGLTPFTIYNISFRDIITNMRWYREIKTLPTDLPTAAEVPQNVIMKVTDTTNDLEFKTPSCAVTYGPIHCQVRLRNLETNEISFGLSKLKKLVPFTNYSLQFKVARTPLYLKNTTKFAVSSLYNFTTAPGVAPRVEKLEVYATDRSSVYLRYNLPEKTRGIPKDVLIQWCHSLLGDPCHIGDVKSKVEIRNIAGCPLWNQKYCIEVTDLIRGYDYRFFVSIRNARTSLFGMPIFVLGTAYDRVPGKPENITYNMIDCDKQRNYCHLNLSWAHPYNQNATITMFDIILNESSSEFAADAWKNIHELYKMSGKSYQPKYSYLVTYILPRVPYKISVRAANEKYKGEYASIKMDIEEDSYVDETPELLRATNESMTFQLPQLDGRLQSSTLIVIVQDYDNAASPIDIDILNLEFFEDENRLCNSFGNTWIAKAEKMSNNSLPVIIIGDNSSSYVEQLDRFVLNKPLQPDSKYCITFTLLNSYKNSENVVVYHAKSIFTEPQPNTTVFSQDNKRSVKTNLAVFVVPVIFVGLWIVCAAWLTYRYWKKHKVRRDVSEPIYESMPFDEYTPGTNQTYDRLLHD